MSSITITEPFSFQELQDANEGAQPPPKPQQVTATDGVELAVRAYLPKEPPSAILVFLHGGGAHSGAGYQHLGQGLSSEYNLAVYMPDLRGHGSSGGPRGDSPSAAQVLNDVTTVLEYARKAHTSGLPLFLGGHSSGGGLVVNYSAFSERLATLSGYLLLAPQLGYLSDTMRPAPADKKQEFATVRILPFVVNGITGLLGHNKAVSFQYSPEVLKDDGMVSFNTVNMANAITPTAPNDQFRAMTLPIGLWVGAEDELFVADKVTAFAEMIEKPADGNCSVVVPGEKHLGILVKAHRFLGPWITNRVA